MTESKENLFRTKWNAHVDNYRKRFQSRGVPDFWRNYLGDMRWWVLRDLLAPLAPPAHVLDLGCGGGLYSGLLHKCGFSVVGLDLSDSALQSNRRMQEVVGQISYLAQADSCKLPYADAVFDAVFSTDVLGHVPDHRSLFAEVQRVLKPGGVFVYLSETDGYRRAPQTWQYQVCQILGEDPWEKIDFHIALVPASNHVKMAQESGFIVEKTYYWVRNHLIFNVLMPRPEPEIVDLYPQVTEEVLFRANGFLVVIHDLITRVKVPYLIVKIASSLLERLWIQYASADTGGVFMKVRKPGFDAQ